MAKKNRNVLAQEIGGRVKVLRQQLNISQMDIVRRTGFSSATLSEIEAGNRLAGLDFVVALRDGYGVNPNWIIFGIGEMFEQRGELEELRARPDPETRIEDTLREFEERLRKLEREQAAPKPRVRKGFQ